MKTPAIVVALASLFVPATSFQLPPPQVPVLPLLCSAVKSWNVKVTKIEVTKTPNDFGSHEEWDQHFILVGDGPLMAGFKAKDFELRPHDEIPNNDPIFVTLNTPSASLSFSNDRAKQQVRFSGKENDAWPNPDDDVPLVEMNIDNPCHASAPLTAALELPAKTKCGSQSGRTACYTITVTPQ